MLTASKRKATAAATKASAKTLKLEQLPPLTPLNPVIKEKQTVSTPPPMPVATPEPPVLVATPMLDDSQPVLVAPPEPMLVAPPEPILVAPPEPMLVANSEPMLVATSEPMLVATSEPKMDLQPIVDGDVEQRTNDLQPIVDSDVEPTMNDVEAMQQPGDDLKVNVTSIGNKNVERNSLPSPKKAGKAVKRYQRALNRSQSVTLKQAAALWSRDSQLVFLPQYNVFGNLKDVQLHMIAKHNLQHESLWGMLYTAEAVQQDLVIKAAYTLELESLATEQKPKAVRKAKVSPLKESLSSSSSSSSVSDVSDVPNKQYSPEYLHEIVEWLMKNDANAFKSTTNTNGPA